MKRRTTKGRVPLHGGVANTVQERSPLNVPWLEDETIWLTYNTAERPKEMPVTQKAIGEMKEGLCCRGIDWRTEELNRLIDQRLDRWRRLRASEASCVLERVDSAERKATDAAHHVPGAASL